MILSFKKQFPDKILSGEKIHSIREDSRGRWVAGRPVHFATGVRTKNYNCFQEGVCVSVQRIEILHYAFLEKQPAIEVIVDDNIKFTQRGNHIYNSNFIKQLAKNDGFDSVEDFFKWFSSDFQGKIIHWTDFRY